MVPSRSSFLWPMISWYHFLQPILAQRWNMPLSFAFPKHHSACVEWLFFAEGVRKWWYHSPPESTFCSYKSFSHPITRDSSPPIFLSRILSCLVNRPASILTFHFQPVCAHLCSFTWIIKFSLFLCWYLSQKGVAKLVPSLRGLSGLYFRFLLLKWQCLYFSTWMKKFL